MGFRVSVSLHPVVVLAARLRWCRERAAALAYAAYVGGLLFTTLPVLWLGLAIVPRGRPADRLVRRWCRGLMTLSGFPIRIEGIENLIEAGPAVLAANHASYLDSVALLAAIPPEWSFVAKRELLSSPLIGSVIRKAGHLTVERTDLTQSVADAERATALLHSGRSLLFFPEGTFVRSPGLRPFRLGAFKAAVEARCPVIPIAIRGTREILPADSWFPRPGVISVLIGAPIKPEGGEWPEIVRLRDLARAEIARLSGERGSH